ncbi:FAD-binding protein [Brevibacillus nitrificans]|uniref:FAD-binding protein n=1 Tax=Brevibacillus nitrificans TaxID=651560 RepID=UPI002861FD65|nr:FAD-binding protein [Brevibacillus nitrificans]MDR7315159.1 FAD/FMN-containing dehydrogenase [Brevibacillus nitrificans]
MHTVNLDTKRWSNWAGNLKSQPKQVAVPDSLEDVVSIVHDCKRTGRSIRGGGSGHSFTPIAQTDDCLLSLDRLTGLYAVDPAEHTVEVWAGTKLKDLGQLLFDQGYSQENLGAINAQSIAGAISTGTHGTGIRLAAFLRRSSV